MGMLTRVARAWRELRHGSIEDYFVTASGPVSTGVTVTEPAIVASTAFYAAIRILGETLGQLPLHLYRRLPDGGKEIARNHYLYPILHDQPNPYMTRFQFIKWMEGNRFVRGNGYAEIERDNAGRVKWLWPMISNDVQMKWDGVTPFYEVQVPGGQKRRVPWINMVHCDGFGIGGFVGAGLMKTSAETVGLVSAMEQYAGRWFGNGAIPATVIETDLAFPPEEIASFTEAWSQMHQGLTRSHRTAILDKGKKLKQIGVDPAASQLLESRRYGVGEVSRISRIPLHMLSNLENATYTNIGEQTQEFGTFTISPNATHWETRLKLDLLTPAERRDYFIEFDMDGLMRGDPETRAKTMSTYVNAGMMSPDEGRAKLNFNPRDDGLGGRFWMPLNVQFAEDAALPPPAPIVVPPPEPEPEPAADEGERAKGGRLTLMPGPTAGTTDLWLVSKEDANETRAASDRLRNRLRRQWKPVILAAAEKLVAREAAEIAKAAERFLGSANSDGMTKWLAEYREDTSRFVKYMKPTIRAYLAAIGEAAEDDLRSAPVDETRATFDEMVEWFEAYIMSEGIRHNRKAIAGLQAAIADVAVADALKIALERTEVYAASGAAIAAERQVVFGDGAVVLGIWERMGGKKIIWRTSDPCEFCAQFEGAVMGIDGGSTIFAGQKERKGPFVPQGWGVMPGQLPMDSGDMPHKPDGSLDAPRTVWGGADVFHPPLHPECECSISVE